MKLLTVSGYSGHKNLEIIRDVVRILRRKRPGRFQFVLTISREDFSRVFAGFYERDVLTVGPVPPDDCPELYRECDFMFLPTLLECFSASYPEAMAMEKPILTSDLGFARSICRDAAVYFDPMDADDIARKIMELDDSPERRSVLIEEGRQVLEELPTARERAESFLRICEKLVESEQGLG